MLYQSINFKQTLSPISQETLQQTPHLTKYVKNWRQFGEFGLLAGESPTNQPISATWFRQLTIDKPR